MKIFNICTFIWIGWLAFGCKTSEDRKADTGPQPLEILFLGHASDHHNSALYMPMLASALSKNGIHLTYTENVEDLNEPTLNQYDGLIIYANHEQITPSQEEALLSFVEGGKGFIPIHCASFCFQNSPEYIELVGGQFLKHDTGTFVANIVQPDHPALEAVEEFSTWDETYVHDKLSDDRTVLMERVEGDHREPWTWVKEYGEGRVFYTAYGHDERTWNNPGFHNLMEAGIIWAVSDQAKQQWQAFQETIPELVYEPRANIPNYEKRDPAPQYQEPFTPEQSKKLMQVPVGFELELFAAEPDIINPIAMEWDEKGRLWVIETVDYPNTVREQDGVGDDRIKICEDTDGDGKADKFTIFADQLNIPTSLVFARGGVIISQAPHFMFLQDTDGDDIADVREKILTGWGTFDTHAGPSNLKYGPDNQIWGVVGYSGFKGNIAGEYYEFSQSLYRFKPDLSSFELLTNTSNNTWGLGFTETNDIFASTANNTHSVYLGIPNKYFKDVEGLPAGGSVKIDGHYAMQPITGHVRQVDVWGGFTAAAGHNFYTARAYPQEFWNRIALVCEPTGHLVHIAIIEKEGAGFVERNGGNLLASADEWVAPVEAKVGPDGAVWVADWYNFIVQHNPTPTPERGGYEAETGEGNAYENPLRDKMHGRIWRIVHRESEPYEPIQLSKDDPEGLLDALKHDNMFWRLTAQRLLMERGDTDILPDLYNMVKGRNVDEMGLNSSAIHALWLIHGLGALEGENKEAYKIAVDALNHPAAGVRKAAIQVLPNTRWANQAILQSQVLQDPDPHTRLTALLAMADMETSDGIGKMVYTLSEEEKIKKDNWLSQAVYTAAAKHKDGFMAAYLEDHPDFEAMQARKNELPQKQDMTFPDAEWESLDLPEFLERAGIDVDGILWFRKVIEVPRQVAGQAGRISLGAINESDQTYVNGVLVGSMKDQPSKDRIYDIPENLLQAGKNVIAIRMEDARGWGGFAGEPETMFVQAGRQKIPLAGSWRYQIEKEYNKAGQPFYEGNSLATAFMESYWNRPEQPQATLASNTEEAATVVHLKTVKNEMKYDISEFAVQAGKPVEIVFENPDFMQHNVVITQPGAKEIVGAAADKLATDPQGAEKQYVPDMPEVLFSTPLANPNETLRLTFTAPEEPGDYPFICTFPGHWRIMQGNMKVVSAESI